jgi:hypothetical protein
MPYFSGSILPPFAFLSIPIPFDSLDEGKLRNLKQPLDLKSFGTSTVKKYAAF